MHSYSQGSLYGKSSSWVWKKFYILTILNLAWVSRKKKKKKKEETMSNSGEYQEIHIKPL